MLPITIYLIMDQKMKLLSKKIPNNIFTSLALLLAGVFLAFSNANADSLLVGNLGTDSVLRYDALTGTFIETYASGNGLNAPHAMVTGPDNNLYVGSRGNNAVLRYDGEGNFIDTFISYGSGGLNNTHGLDFGADGNLYVCSQVVMKYCAMTVLRVLL